MAQHRSIRLGFDLPLVLAIITLVTFGALMVYSASYDFSAKFAGGPTAIFLRQMRYIGVGFIILIFCAWMDYRWWQRLAVPMMVGTVVLLFAVLFISDVRNGATRTLAGGSYQPSELAKIVTIIYLSVWLYARRDKLNDITFGLIPMGVILGVLCALIVKQPDLSAALTVMILGGLMFFLAGGELKQILLVGGIAAFLAAALVQFNLTGSDRIGSFQAGLHNPMNASYHVLRSMEAFANGGWLGVGIGNSLTKLTGLPFPQTDSIFAVVGEETGVIGAGLLILLYSILLWRGLTIAHRAPDTLGRLMAAGLTIWICVEAFINMAVMVNLLPFAGNALPFVSSGGSNLLVSFTAIGILLNISRRGTDQQDDMWRSLRAVTDLRRWDRGRRVSRSNGSSGARGEG